MAKDNQIRLPSGQGGLTRFSDEFKSRIELSPKAVMILVFVVLLLVLILHQIGGRIFN
ncbi:MAG: preprotein translocase subunit Sec61beta [archaeon]|nr:preprotein translocase subunit Sec61beta [archaeon]